MQVPTAFVHQAQFGAAVTQAFQRLVPDVVSIVSNLGNDWSGEPAVFFLVILSDAASSRERLLSTSHRVEQVIGEEVQPLERWGVLPYFNYRSQTEQARLDQLAVA